MRLLRLLSVAIFAATIGGCVSPIVIDEAVLAYDRALSRVRSEALLLNIARARRGLPLAGTEVTALTATFEFEASANLGGGASPIGGPTGPTGELSVGLSTRAQESPTLSIVPLQGEELTRRLLSPLDARTLEFLLHRGVGIGLLLRLLGQAAVVEQGGQRVTFRNDPDRPDELVEFRRRALHLDSLAGAGKLEVGPIQRREEWRPPAGGDVDALMVALDHGFELLQDAKGPLLSRVVDGRILVSNYDPDVKPEAERRALELRARAYPPSFVLVDVRPDGPGGDYPFQGWIKLRSLYQTLEFVGRGADPTWEPAVSPNRATAPVPAQPTRTLALQVSASRPSEASVAFAVELDGEWLSIPAPAPGAASYDWNLRAFQALMDVYHLTTRNAGAAPTTVVAVGGR